MLSRCVSGSLASVGGNENRDLFDDAVPSSVAQLDGLYPASLSAELEKLRNLRNEIRMLENVRDGRMTASGGVVRYRDSDLSRLALPGAIANAQAEAQVLEARIAAHDKQCRSVHRAVAAKIDGGWRAYHTGLVAILHYADHTICNLRDAQDFLASEYAVVTIGKITQGKRARLVRAAAVVYVPLAQVFAERTAVKPDRSLLARLGVDGDFKALLDQEFTLPRASDKNLGEWLQAVDSWVDSACSALGHLRRDALEQLLECERRIESSLRNDESLEDAPAASCVPANYATLVPGSERKRDKTLGWWDRFQAADGMLPGIARLLVASVIVFCVVGFGTQADDATLLLHNGLNATVTVTVAGRTHKLAGQETTSIDLPVAPLHVEARSANDRLIETFDEKSIAPFQTFVYNVASAAPLVEWTAVYGDRRRPRDRRLGIPRWSLASADVLFTEPPKSISSNGGGGTRTVLTGLGYLAPQEALDLVGDELQRATLVHAHARWDDTNSTNALGWLRAASKAKGFNALLEQRLALAPKDVVLLRFEQDTSGVHHDEVCARQAKLAVADPDDADLQYLSTRCQPDGDARDHQFVQGYRHWPRNPWWALAAGYVFDGSAKWNDADSALATAMQQPALADSVALQLARVRRAAQIDAPVDISDLAKHSSKLRWMLNLEKDGPYARFDQGKLDEAIRVASKNVNRERLIRLAAASDGASTALAHQALAMPWDKGIDTGTIGAAIGLATRERADWSALESKLKLYIEEPDALRRFVVALRQAIQSPATCCSMAWIPLHVGKLTLPVSPCLASKPRQRGVHWRGRCCSFRSVRIIGEEQQTRCLPRFVNSLRRFIVRLDSRINFLCFAFFTNRLTRALCITFIV